MREFSTEARLTLKDDHLASCFVIHGEYPRMTLVINPKPESLISGIATIEAESWLKLRDLINKKFGHLTTWNGKILRSKEDVLRELPNVQPHELAEFQETVKGFIDPSS